MADGGAEVRQKLNQISVVEKRRIVLSENGHSRVCERKRCTTRRSTCDQCARTVRALKNEELHTEEGRLDEVFRNITQSETSQKDSV